MGTFSLEHRPDGSTVILLSRPVVIGTFPDADMARRVLNLLLLDEAAPGLAAAMETPVPVAVPPPPAAPVPQPVAPARPVANLPAVVSPRPTAPARLASALALLTEDQKSAAFRRIADGEKLAAVAADIGVPMNQLRGSWAAHKSQMQRHYAEGGQIACKLCTKPFTPSLTHPDTCARCSHEA